MNICLKRTILEDKRFCRAYCSPPNLYKKPLLNLIIHYPSRDLAESTKMKLITCLIIVLLSVESTLQFRCSKKIFDGRPKEWQTDAGKEIAAYGGYWTLDQCRLLCEATSGCQEFRIKKNSDVSYSGCVLMKAGTTESGQYTSSFTCLLYTSPSPRDS